MANDLEELKRAIRARVVASLPPDYEYEPPDDDDEIRARIISKLLAAPDLASKCPRSRCRRQKMCRSGGAPCLAIAGAGGR